MFAAPTGPCAGHRLRLGNHGIRTRPAFRGDRRHRYLRDNARYCETPTSPAEHPVFEDGRRRSARRRDIRLHRQSHHVSSYQRHSRPAESFAKDVEPRRKNRDSRLCMEKKRAVAGMVPGVSVDGVASEHHPSYPPCRMEDLPLPPVETMAGPLDHRLLYDSS